MRAQSDVGFINNQGQQDNIESQGKEKGCNICMQSIDGTTNPRQAPS